MNEIKGEIPEPTTIRPWSTGTAINSDPEPIPINTWQKCPICQGSGKRFMYSDTGGNHFVSDYNDCEICEGKRIISTATGKPPSDD